jgi:ATPase subunit of ABC transporter with duplicated ATPase domains
VRDARVREQKKARVVLEREQRRLDAVRRNLSAKRRMKNPNDHDARSMGAKVRVEHAEATVSRAVRVRRGQLERAAERVEEFVVDKTLGKSVFVDYEPAAKPRLLSLIADEIRAGEKVLLRNVRLTLDRDEKVRLVGPNGVGKTTLIRALLASTKSDRIRYLPQELDREECRELRQRIDTLDHRERGRLLSILVALGVDPDQLAASHEPSPGEARKLAIAFGFAEHASLLVLDEPTNHLDLPSIERLERALAEFPGALLVVSHDAAFAEKTTRGVWSIEEGAVKAL